jgi:protein phosphatase PTC7
MGSDGLFDNLSDDVILRTVASVPARASVISRKLVDLSRTVSLDVEADTPFAKLAKRAGFEGYEIGRGGKVDDISCVVVCCK